MSHLKGTTANHQAFVEYVAQAQEQEPPPGAQDEAGASPPEDYEDVKNRVKTLENQMAEMTEALHGTIERLQYTEAALHQINQVLHMAEQIPGQ